MATSIHPDNPALDRGHVAYSGAYRSYRSWASCTYTPIADETPHLNRSASHVVYRACGHLRLRLQAPLERGDVSAPSPSEVRQHSRLKKIAGGVASFTRMASHTSTLQPETNSAAKGSARCVIIRNPFL